MQKPKLDGFRVKMALLTYPISGILKVIMQIVVKAYSILGIGGMFL